MKMTEKQIQRLVNEEVRRYKAANKRNARLDGIIKECVSKAIKRKMNEDLEWDDNGYPTNLPDDVCEWASKMQGLGVELSRLVGKYRMDGQWDELYNQLRDLHDSVDAVCADINTYGMASHYSL